MKPSERLIEFIKRAEGCRLKAYQDVAGVWTIGYGHTKDVKPGDSITQYQADQFLRQDVGVFASRVNRLRCINTQGKFDAITDFCYNLGMANYESSTLRRYIESGRATWEIQEQFLRWVNAGGKKQGGLVSRRIWEAARYAE